MSVSRKQVVINGVRDYILTGKYTDRETARKALVNGIEEATRNGIAEEEVERLAAKVDYWFKKKESTNKNFWKRLRNGPTNFGIARRKGIKIGVTVRMRDHREEFDGRTAKVIGLAKDWWNCGSKGWYVVKTDRGELVKKAPSDLEVVSESEAV